MIMVEFQKLHFMIALWTLKRVIAKRKKDKLPPGIEVQDEFVFGACHCFMKRTVYFPVACITVLEKARSQGITLPIMMLTAMGEVDDRINGLDAGADDYLAKPFAGGELLARVRALLRRTDSFKPDLTTCGDLCLDRNSYRLSCGKNHVNLGNKAFQMMEMFMLTPHKVISANEFMEYIWGWDSEAEINVVWVNISFLRKQLLKLDSKIKIRVVRGAGYMLEGLDD